MNSFGRIFRISIFGESHGPAVGVTIDGCPPGIPLTPEDFSADLSRRRSGAKGTTPRTEADTPEFLSGLFNGHTTGSPLTIVFMNSDTKAKDYQQMTRTPRPGHADFVAHKRFGGFNDYRGGGHFSGRLTVALVAAGVVAKKLIQPTTVTATLKSVGGKTDIDTALDEAIRNGDSLGGLIECVTSPLEIGLGEPFFDSLESLLSHAVFSIPAIKGIEFGSGFAAARMKGSDHNDAYLDASGNTATNNAGGISGGLSNGNPLVFRVAVKPTSSIKQPVGSVDLQSGQPVQLSIEGRHDVCLALRVPPVVEAVTACVLADCKLLRSK